MADSRLDYARVIALPDSAVLSGDGASNVPAAAAANLGSVVLSERHHDCVHLAGYAGGTGLAEWLAESLTPVRGTVPPGPGTSTLVMDGEARLLAVAPATWLLIGKSGSLRSWARRSASELTEHAAVTDFSQGRSVALSMRGTAVRDVLAMHISIDLDDGAFPIGACATTGIHHVGVTVLHEDIDSYLILMQRSFAASLWDFLLDSATPCGVVTGAALP